MLEECELCSHQKIQLYFTQLIVMTLDTSGQMATKSQERDCMCYVEAMGFEFLQRITMPSDSCLQE